jgi:hypothetical protein
MITLSTSIKLRNKRSCYHKNKDILFHVSMKLEHDNSIDFTTYTLSRFDCKNVLNNDLNLLS